MPSGAKMKNVILYILTTAFCSATSTSSFTPLHFVDDVITSASLTPTSSFTTTRDSDYEDKYASFHPQVLSYGPLLFKSSVSTQQENLPEPLLQAEDNHKPVSSASRDTPGLVAEITEPLTKEDFKSAPYESLPLKYTDQPTSFDAVNTYVRDTANTTEAATTQNKTVSVIVPRTSPTNTSKDIHKIRVHSEEEKKNSPGDVETATVKPKARISKGASTAGTIVDVPELHDVKIRPKKNLLQNDTLFKPSNKAAGFVASQNGSNALNFSPKSPEFSIPSAPVQSSFGVSVDFAGQLSDNPLYRKPGAAAQVAPVYISSAKPKTTTDVYTWTTSRPSKTSASSDSVQADNYEGGHFAVQNAPSAAYSKYIIRTTTEEPLIPGVVIDSTLESKFVTRATASPYYQPIYPPATISTAIPFKYIVSTSATPTIAIFDPLLDTNFAPPETRPVSPAAQTVPADARQRSPLQLTPTYTVPRLRRPKPLLLPRPRPRRPQTRLRPIVSEPFVDRMSFVVNKIMGAHYGDNVLDFFDFIPLIALLIIAGVLLAALFPNGITNLGLSSTNGNLVLNGRGHDTTALDEAIGHLESGTLKISELRRETGDSKW